jgi:peptide/nickel transport system permease protein
MKFNNDYVRTARAKGVPEKTVMMKHVLRNAMILILTNIGIAIQSRHFVGLFFAGTFFFSPSRAWVINFGRGESPP